MHLQYWVFKFILKTLILFMRCPRKHSAINCIFYFPNFFFNGCFFLMPHYHSFLKIIVFFLKRWSFFSIWFFTKAVQMIVSQDKIHYIIEIPPQSPVSFLWPLLLLEMVSIASQGIPWSQGRKDTRESKILQSAGVLNVGYR